MRYIELSPNSKLSHRKTYHISVNVVIFLLLNTSGAIDRKCYNETFRISEVNLYLPQNSNECARVLNVKEHRDVL